MKTDIKLVETKKGLFEFVGELEFYEKDTKYIEVDGEQYSKIEVKEVVKTISQIYEKSDGFYNQEYEYDFKELDLHFKIKDYNGFKNGLGSFIATWSSNNYVNNLKLAFNSGILDKRITQISTGDRWGKNEWDEILRSSEVSFHLEDYGWKYTVNYSITLESLFSLDYKRIPKHILKLFRDNGINLKSKNKVEEATDMLKQIAKYKLKEKQRWNQ